MFPIGSLGGAAYLKEIRAPLDQVPMIASGSVGLHNIREIIKAGAFAAGIGGNLVNREWIESGNFAALQKLSRELVSIIAELT